MFVTFAFALLSVAAQQIDSTVPVERGQRLEVNAFAGEISVATWARNAVRVEADPSSRTRIEINRAATVVEVRTVGRRGTPEMIDLKVTVPEWLPDTPEVRRDLALYYDEIARMDRESGQVLDQLAKRGLADNTLVIFTGDNGMPFPPRAKGTLYEHGIRVPFIARWPGRIKPGSVTGQLASHIDLAPTWLEAAGAPKSLRMQGVSLLPVFQGGANPVRREKILGITQAFSSLGGVMVTYVFTWVARNGESLPAIAGGHEAWRYTLLSGLIPALPLIILRPFLPESPVWLQRRAA